MMAMRSTRRWRSVAITAAGSGLGREIALGFAAKGCIVFGTATTAAQVQDLKDASGGRVSLAVCDVTREDAIRAWVGGVSDALDGAGLDALINNTGILTPGPIEILPLDAIRHEFEVNVFGALSVINAFLPALRKARGRIVQISSWMASVPLPFNGLSGASNAAIEVLSAVYRAELGPFGIDVVVISGSTMKADGVAETAALARVANGMTSKQRELYGKAFATFADRLNGLQAGGVEPSAVAARIIEIAEQHPAPSRVAVGPEAEEMLRMAREKSDAELDALRLQLVGLG